VSDDQEWKSYSFWSAVAAMFWWLREHSKQANNKQPELKENDMATGIKNLMEVLKMAKKISIFLIKKLKDGIQLQDGVDLATALMLDPEFKACIADAVADFDQVGIEASDIDLSEGLEIAKFGIESVPEYIEALKKTA
jgi:hypothetical protein